MQRIPVQAASASYEVLVGAGLLRSAAESIAPIAEGRRLFVVVDQNVLPHHGAALEAALTKFDVTMLPVELGEQRKRLSTVEDLAQRMHRAGADRSAVVVAFGGGVAGDVGGFVAASYMRGVDVIQIPTTLLSQVDASVGGKTGVNLASGKNLVGAFHQPRLVLMDPELVLSLPARDYRAGLYEVIKHGIIRDAALLAFMSQYRGAALQRDPAALERMVADSVRIKAAVVADDEREGGLRRILNYGHTLGHALEAETQHSRLLHGEAVGWGMVAAGRLAESLGLLHPDDRASIERLILDYGEIPSLSDLHAEAIADHVAGDKKTIGGTTNFVLAEHAGKVRIVQNPPHESVVRAAHDALAAYAAVPGAATSA